MKHWIFQLLVICMSVAICISYFMPRIVVASEEDDRLKQLTKQIDEYQSKIETLKKEANTLSNQVAQFDAQIKLAELKIDQTREKIILLGGRIDRLQGSLQSLSNAYNARVIETYKMSRIGDPFLFVMASQTVKDAVARFYYLQKLQSADHSLLSKLQNAQNTYKQDKTNQEILEKDLETQMKNLAAQKVAKANLLTVTRNDEKKYQELLNQTRAELEAIQAIIAGRGKETEVGHVNEGAKIASIIQGPSCNSSGAHLHFIVGQKGKTLNPFNYLKPGISFENCSGSSCNSSDGDSFNPSGSWNWPINPKVHYSQGYGSTWATRNTWVGRIYNFHNGIDIDSDSSSEVKAAQSGTLFRGSYSGTNNCALRYVRVDHDNTDIETYYLHINY